MKRYKVNLGLNISAKTKKEAYKIVKQVIESGTATTKDHRWMGIKLQEYNPKTIEELAF